MLNVNEAPAFNVATPTDNIEGMAADKAEEGVGRDAVWTAAVSTYTVADPEGVDIDGGKWTLSGDDEAKFKLTGADCEYQDA